MTSRCAFDLDQMPPCRAKSLYKLTEKPTMRNAKGVVQLANQMGYAPHRTIPHSDAHISMLSRVNKKTDRYPERVKK